MSMMPVNNPINHGWKEEDGKLLPILDIAAPRQGCVPPGCEVHLHKNVLPVHMHEDKVEVHSSV